MAIKLTEGELLLLLCAVVVKMARAVDLRWKGSDMRLAKKLYHKLCLTRESNTR